MNITSNLPQVVANTATQTGDSVTLSVLKKANELEGQAALQLLLSATQVVQQSQQASAPNPSLGNRLDTYA